MPKPALLLIMATALALRLAVGLWWQSRLPQGDQFGFGDSDSYWALGRTIARGEPYQYGSPDARVFRTPGYPLLLAPLFWFGGNDPPAEWAYALSAVLGAAAVGAMYWLTRLLFDERAGLLAAAIVALYPGAVSEGALVLSEAPFTLLMLISLALWIEGLRRASAASLEPNEALGGTTKRRIANLSHYGIAAAAGISAGLATLVRPSWLLFTPLALGIGILFYPQRKRQLLFGAAMLAGLALTMAPWWARNWQVTGRFVATSLQTGASLYDGLNPSADGGSDMRFVERFTRDEHLRDAQNPPAVGSEPFEVRLDRQHAECGARLGGRSSRTSLQLAAIKFMRTWNVWPNEPGLRSWPMRLLVAATYLPLLGCGIWGVVRFTRRGFAYALCWLPAAYFSMLHMIFVGSIRYREPAMIALAALAAGAICTPRQRPALPLTA